MENKETKANEPIQLFVANSTDPNLADFVKSALNQSKRLTKREYFAAMAMQGLLANYGSSYSVQNTMEAVYMADALIDELNKTK